jgi:hypothetical protein
MSDEDLENSAENYERVKKIKKYNKEEFKNNYMNALLNNPKELWTLIETSYFYANKHSIHDRCPSENHECEYCYSSDTEFDTKEFLKDALKKIWLLAYSNTTLLEDSNNESDDDLGNE